MLDSTRGSCSECLMTANNMGQSSLLKYQIMPEGYSPWIGGSDMYNKRSCSMRRGSKDKNRVEDAPDRSRVAWVCEVSSD